MKNKKSFFKDIVNIILLVLLAVQIFFTANVTYFGKDSDIYMAEHTLTSLFENAREYCQNGDFETDYHDDVKLRILNNMIKFSEFIQEKENPELAYSFMAWCVGEYLSTDFTSEKDYNSFKSGKLDSQMFDILINSSLKIYMTDFSSDSLAVALSEDDGGIGYIPPNFRNRFYTHLIQGLLSVLVITALLIIRYKKSTVLLNANEVYCKKCKSTTSRNEKGACNSCQRNPVLLMNLDVVTVALSFPVMFFLGSEDDFTIAGIARRGDGILFSILGLFLDVIIMSAVVIIIGRIIYGIVLKRRIIHVNTNAQDVTPNLPPIQSTTNDLADKLATEDYNVKKDD